MSEEKQAVKNAADSEQVKKAGKKDKQKLSRESMDLKTVLGTTQGRRFIFDIIAESGYQERFTGVTEDMQFLLGRRDVGMRIVEQIIKVDPALWILMQKEAFEIKENV